MTQLRKRVLDELERRNYSQATARAYVGAIRRFAEHFHRSPDQLGLEHVRQYQLYLVQERKVRPRTVMIQMAALRFLFLKTLKRRFSRDDLPSPRLQRQLPLALSPEEVTKLIDSAANLRHRTILMTLYSTGVRRSELCRLRPEDIDKQRMVIHIRQGKGGYDRDVPLSPKLLDQLRAYYRSLKHKNGWLFPSLQTRRQDQPMTTKADNKRQMTLAAPEFIHRFLLHVLPRGFVRIRHFGWMSNRCRHPMAALCRLLLGAQNPAHADSAGRAGDCHRNSGGTRARPADDSRLPEFHG